MRLLLAFQKNLLKLHLQVLDLPYRKCHFSVFKKHLFDE